MKASPTNSMNSIAVITENPNHRPTCPPTSDRRSISCKIRTTLLKKTTRAYSEEHSRSLKRYSYKTKKIKSDFYCYVHHLTYQNTIFTHYLEY